MHRVKFNDYAELLSDDLNNNNAYLYNGLITTISDFIAANDCVSGLEVTAQAVPDMTVYVKSGRIYQKGYQGLLEADLTTPLTIAPASASQPRIDLICAKYEEVEDEPEIRNVMTDVVSRNITQVEVKTRIASSIAFQVVGGTAAAEPTVPTTPEGWVALAKVTVPANASVIQQSNIVDMRPEIINIYQHDHSGGANGAKLDYNNLNNLPDLSDFTGATAEAAGKRGMVPAPAAGDQNKALFGDATYKSVVQSINGITPTSGDVDINRKFYNSLTQLGLNYGTVTFDQIANTLPVNSTLTFYVDIVTSQPTYAPNLAIPVSGFIVVTKGDNNAVPIKFTLSPITNNATTYLGEYTTYNSYGFKGWQPIVLSVNGAKPNYTGNVTVPVDTYTAWNWTDGDTVIKGFTVKFPNGYKQCVWYLYFPSGYSAMTINFPKAFSEPPCVFGSIVVANDSTHLTANVYDVTTTSCRCVTNNKGNTATYWIAIGYDS